MITTNALYKPDLIHPKSSKSDKWKTILSPIWEEIHPPKKPKKGSSISNCKRPAAPNQSVAGGSVIYLPSDPNALFDRLELLLASKQAGNTGIRNELVAICDELKRLG